MSLTLIRAVDPASPARRAGIRPGEKLLEVNGHPIVDVLDYKYYTYDAHLTLRLRRGDGGERTVRVRKEAGEDLGLDFETYLMDRARSCANHCIFCFIDQLPKGMRESLYFKDDDARLSFLMGNYITLTNLSEREVERICDLRVSPVNVSVHTADPALRAEMLGFADAGRGLAVMERFAKSGIVMNCQIVACRGINDGAALEQTMDFLENLYPQVGSVSVVPVGLTCHREGLYPLTPYDAESAAAVVDQVEARAEKCLAAHGSRIFWCSDEFYLRAGRAIPSDEYFEDYTQLENGVGMLRLLKTEFDSALRLADPGPGEPRRFSLACGTDAAPWLAALVDSAAEKCHTVGVVYPIRNDFFGESITVSGLVTGQDLIAQLRGKDLGECVLLSANMLRAGERVFLDDVTLSDAERELGVPVIPVAQDGFALLDAMLGVQECPPDAMPGLPEDEYYRYNPARRGTDL